MSEKKSIKTGLIGVDTTFLIDFFKGEQHAVEFMQEYASRIRINELVVYEFLCGNLSEKKKELFLQAIAVIPSISYSRESTLVASTIFRQARKKGKSVSHQDAMIAGIYLSEDICHIVSRNEKHFSNIPSCEVITY